jgi:phenylpropionate dioxygenase-like ring-hydroxylating dioxygenase large terminal subunit
MTLLASRIPQLVDEELERATYPDGFPPLPPLPTARYRDEGFARLEKEFIWLKQWLCVGHVSQFPSTGSFQKIDRLGISIVLVRAKDQKINAFYNSCTHRGAEVIFEKSGRTPSLTCRYHGWSFGLDGALRGVPAEKNFACLHKAERGLRPIRCEIWHGFVFINLDDEAAPLSDHLAPLEREIDGFPLDDVVVISVQEIEVDCNWKLVYENFLESYHLRTIHQTTLAPFFDLNSFTVNSLPNGHGRQVHRKREAKPLFVSEELGTEVSADVFLEHTIALAVFPNNIVAIDPYAFAWQSFWPTSIDTGVITLMNVAFQREVAPEFHEQQQQALALSAKAFAEDVAAVTSVQRTVSSGAVENFMVSCQERQIYWVHEELDRQIGPERIADDLRVAPVMQAYVLREAAQEQ